MRAFKTLKSKLIAAMLLVTVVPLIALSISNLRTYKESYRELGLTRARVSAYSSAQRIDSVLRLTSTTMYLQGSDTRFIELVETLTHPEGVDPSRVQWARQRVEERFARFLEFNQGWRQIRLFGARGEEVVRVGRGVAGRPQVVHELRDSAEDVNVFLGAQRVFSQPHLWPRRDSDQALVMSCSMALRLPIANSQAVLSADIAIADLASGSLHSGNSSGRGVIMTAPNEPITRANRTLTQDSIAVIRPEWESAFWSEVPVAVEGDDNTFVAFSSFSAPVREVSWEGPGNPRWVLVQETSSEDVFAPLFISTKILVYVLVGALVAASFLALWLARNIARPLTKLRDGAAIIGEGNWSHRIDVQGRDEVGQVANEFNLMAARLESLYDSLEQRIEAKTAELRFANEALSRDNEERKKLEAQLIQSEKLSSIGLMASSVAHEINNPMGIISMHGQIILKKAKAGDVDVKKIESILTQCDRVASITRSLLNLARPRPVKFALIDVHEVLQSILGLVEIRLKKTNVALELELAKSIPEVRGDGGQLAQVFLNLILNAEQAMDGGGVLNVSSSISSDSALGSAVCVVFQDTGKGISEKERERLFEPFFTTKSQLSGSGLGLAVSAGIVKSHGGRIDVHSHVGKGASFSVVLPIPS